MTLMKQAQKLFHFPEVLRPLRDSWRTRPPILECVWGVGGVNVCSLWTCVVGVGAGAGMCLDECAVDGKVCDVCVHTCVCVCVHVHVCALL